MAKLKSAKIETVASEKDLCRHTKEYFNLIAEPWIPVVWLLNAQGLPGRTGTDARPSELGLRDTLLHAHEIAEVADQSPLVTAALHRLLIALVHAVYRGPEKSSEWIEMWQAGSFDTAKTLAYFQQWHPRFWLFHPKHPFLQWPKDDLGNPVPVTLLNMAIASTGDATLFDHSLDSTNPGFAPSEAARQLMAFLTFKPGGFVEGVPGERAEASALAAPWADGAAFLCFHENLFATLMINLMLPDRRNGIMRKLGEPEWERSAPSPRTPPKQSTNAGPPANYLEFLTAPCRHVRMSEPDLVGLVRHIRLQLGCTFNVNGPVDPGKVYHVDKKTGWRPIGLQADRALWRNSATLLELSGDEHVQAGALAQLASLGEHGIVPADLVVGLRAFGTIGSRAKVDLWRSETLPIPVHVLANPDRRVLIEDCLGLTGDVERALRSSVWALVCDLVPQTKEEKERKALRDHLDVTRLYWVALETPFKCDVLGAPASADLDQVRRRWGEKCMALARDALVKALNGLAASGRTLQASAGAERTLSYRLQEVRGRHNLN